VIQKSSSSERRKTTCRKKKRNSTIKGLKNKKNMDKLSNQEKVSFKPKTRHQNSQELATADQVKMKRDDDIMVKKSIPPNKRFVLGRKKFGSTK
jgi:hypothetical protein